MSTQIDRLTELAKEDPKRQFYSITHMIMPEALYAAFRGLRKKASAGVDGVMIRAFPATQRVFLFEPQCDCLTYLNELSLPGKIVVPCAVSDKPGHLDFYTSSQGSGGASLYKRSDSFCADIPQSQINVPAVVLDDIIEKNEVDVVDFAKLDIEGGELSGLRGAEKSLARGVIKALSFEFGSGNINSRTFLEISGHF
jgi:FkbM family methyltransferase